MKVNLFAFMVALTIAAPAGAADMSIKMGNEGTYPPFSMTNSDGSLTGLEPDLAREVCKRLDADCEIVAYEFKALLPSLVTGKIDMIVSQLTPKPERLEKTEFTDPVLTNPTDWIVPISWDDPFDAEGLSGKRIGGIKGSWFIPPLRDLAPDADLNLYDNINQMALDLEAGRIDLVMGGRINWARKFADSDLDSKFKLVSNDSFDGGDEGRSWAVQKGNTELRDKVNEALVSIFEDCTYTEIREKYIPVPVSDREPANCT